jgi:tetratricopeptide (TPR) repeat protein
MKSAARSGRITAGALIAILIAGIIPVLPLRAQELGKTKSMAGTQHEIVMLLIKKKEYTKAAAEADKIFALKWPEDQEPLLLRELLIISDQLRQQGQAALSLQLIDRNSKCFKTTESRIALFKETGFLYKSLNQDDKAMEYFNKARELENKN